MSTHVSKIIDFEKIGETSDGKPICRVTVDKLPDNFAPTDYFCNGENGDAEIRSLGGELKGILKDAQWYNEAVK